jgi:Proteasome/cyclosome repeat
MIVTAMHNQAAAEVHCNNLPQLYAHVGLRRDFLLKSLRETGNEVTQHGAALGLGIARLGSRDEEVFEDLKNVLYTDSAVAGEVDTRLRLSSLRSQGTAQVAVMIARHCVCEGLPGSQW